jgi:hypothetical protein
VGCAGRQQHTSIGGGHTALPRAYADRRAEAYERMVADVSNRWRTHRRPSRPERCAQTMTAAAVAI